MRTLLLGLLSLFFVCASGRAQTSTPTALDAATLTAEAIAAFSATPVASVHLTGTAHAIAGSTNETGSFSFDIQNSGESNLQIEAGALTHDEFTSGFDADPACTWSGEDGVKHAAAQHNCLLSVNWMLPAMAVEIRGAKLNIATVDNPIDSLPAISVSVLVKSGKRAAERYAKLTTVTMALDSGSLPGWLSYNAHPDNDENRDIPILIRYSDYRQVSGATIPFHVQRYINNSLALDLQVENATAQ